MSGIGNEPLMDCIKCVECVECVKCIKWIRCIQLQKPHDQSGIMITRRVENIENYDSPE